MVREADDLEAEVKPVKVPETLKDGKASSVAKQMASPWSATSIKGQMLNYTLE